jgi:hypothetical protein
MPEHLPDCQTEAAAALTMRFADCPCRFCVNCAAQVQGPAHCCAVPLQALLLLVPAAQQTQTVAVASGPEGMAASSAGRADDAAAGRAATAAATGPAQPLHSDPGTYTCDSTSHAVSSADKGVNKMLLQVPVFRRTWL